MIMKMIREFPLSRIQTGAVLGNGETGLMVWGEEHTLNITLGNATMWDHRGGCEWSRKQEFPLLADALDRKDMDAIREMFKSDNPDGIRRATLIPLGRIVLTFPENMVLKCVETDFLTGVVTVRGSYGLEIRIAVAMSKQDLALSGVPKTASVELKPAWDLTNGKYAKFRISEADTLAERGFTPPLRFKCGFIQSFPVDPSAALLWERKNDEIHCVFRRGITDESAAEKIPFTSFSDIQAESQEYYGNFMERIPEISTPDDPVIEQIYYEWAYRYAATTNPKGISPGLQGAFLEDDRLAPWSGDYHFNINAQMINSPGLKLNSPANIRKLFDLVLSWKDKLHYNADCFVREPEGIMLSHAVDDRGKPMGGFWTGAIDHACSAWIAKLMVEYCDIYNDMEFLKNHVYDFMSGIMRVYKKLLARCNGKLYLPVTISPEYRGNRMDAWGINASFQLAALHNLAGNLIDVSNILGKPVDPLWTEIQTTIPQYTIYEDPISGPEIALWEGMPLRESHRHHSHLAGIFPFKTIDPMAQENSEVLKGTMGMWTQFGMGSWTGWCVPWASVIRTRCGYPDMAVFLLKLWKCVFTNQGGASLHDSPFQGFTEWANFRGEVMQLDGGMGAVFAVSELFVHEYQGELRCFFGIPKHWKYAEIKGLHTAGGFILSGIYERGRLVYLKVTASRDNTLRLRLPEASQLFAGSERMVTKMKVGEELVFG